MVLSGIGKRSNRMITYDFGRSFFTFGIDLDAKPPKTISAKPRYPSNYPRVVIESTTRLTDRKTATWTDYVLSASCKSENVAEPENLWMKPNADCCFVVSKEEFMVIKRWHKNNPGVKLWPPSLGLQPERHSSAVKDAWVSLSIDLCKTNGRVLKMPGEVVESTFKNRPLICRLEYDDGDHNVIIQHPVKTINVNKKHNYFQTDTGPILLPNLSSGRLRKAKRQIELLDLAYVACNSAKWAEFVIDVPTLVTKGVTVNHYSKFRRIDNMKNTMIEIS
jgi:hypothetical protein